MTVVLALSILLVITSVLMILLVTAVYILRALGKVMMGPLLIPAGSSNELKNGNTVDADAQWNEKLAAVLLIAGVVLVGVAPMLLQRLINPSSTDIMKNISRALF